jgi:hypothetical protein
VGHHFDPPRGRDDADQLVPLQIQRAGIVCTEFEPSAIEPLDLAGEPIAVRERDDVRLRLGGCGLGHDERDQQPDPDRPEHRTPHRSATMTVPHSARRTFPTA